jgi:hypothetical protein
MNEQDRVHEIMQDMHDGDDSGDKLVFDKKTKTIRPAASVRDSDKGLSLTPSDMEHFN